MSNIRLIQLNNYIRPQLQENKSKNWVLNGDKNSFYQYIIDRYNGSPTNAAVINTFIDLMYGKGLVATNAHKQVSDWTNFLTILKKSELRKVISDFVLFGEASLQIIKSKGGKDIAQILHIPKEKVAPSLENEDGEIEGYWFNKDWSKPNNAVFYPSFGTSSEPIEIYVIKPYKAGKQYFSDPFYLSALPYAEMEEELSNFYIKSIKQGLSAGYVINIPDGKSLTDEEKDDLEKKIKAKLTGSQNAMNFVISFNGRDAEINIVPFPVNEQQHKQWEYLTIEARQQIMTGHRVTSPSLIGVSNASGFSSVADEMDMAESQLMKRVINPMQRFVIEALDDIMNAYSINLDLKFLPLTEEKTAAVEMSSNEKKKVVADDLIALGEDLIGDEWELIDERQCDEMTISENQLNGLIQLATAPRTTNKKSDQDTTLFKVRYKYAGDSTGERDFCNKVLSADRFYRAEDLRGKKTWNSEFAPSGESSYDTFLFKGGVNCKHFWIRHIFLKKGNDNITVSQATKMILELEPKDRKAAKWEQNDKRVAQVAEKQNNYWSLKPNYRKSGVTPKKN
jgi:hypothetical protein